MISVKRERHNAREAPLATAKLYWISWEQDLGKSTSGTTWPASWPPPSTVLAYWEAAREEDIVHLIALVRGTSAGAAWISIAQAWSPGVRDARFCREYPSDGPPRERFPPPDWSIALGRWPWSSPPSKTTEATGPRLPRSGLRLEDTLEIRCCGMPCELRGNLSLRGAAGAAHTRLAYECARCYRRLQVVDDWDRPDAQALVAIDETP